MDRDVLALMCNLVDAAFNPPHVRSEYVNNAAHVAAAYVHVHMVNMK